MADELAGGDINSPDYWNKRFFEDWIARGGRQQTAFFAELCCRELPEWLAADLARRRSTIFDYGCALGDALPVLQRAFPESPISGGDIAQVGLGLARALHPGFEFVDTATLGDKVVADVVYCSNTLEHFDNWTEMLSRLAVHAKDYVIAVVPFEEDERIDEHVFTFEFDTLPARLPSGARLLHLGVVDAAREPETHWYGLQLIAVWGRKRRRREQAAGAAVERRAGAMIFDLRGVKTGAIPPLLANIAALSREKRRLARELTAAQQVVATETAAHAAATARIEQRAGALAATLKGAVGDYGDLTQSLEAHQRWLIAELNAIDPALLKDAQVSPVPEGWLDDLGDDEARHKATLVRLTDAFYRATQLGLAFKAKAGEWRDGWTAARDTRRLLEQTIGERDRALAPAPTTSAAHSPLVSIVLPVYNQAGFIDEAIAGVLSQSYANWELIVIDDGSTDDLAARVRRHVDERRLIFLRQPNQKLPAALNHGFAAARGELLTWTSADNIMLPAQLERLVAELAAHPEIGLVYSDYWAIDDQGGPLDMPDWRSHNRDPEIPGLIRVPDAVTMDNFHLSGDDFIGASFLYRREVADIVGRYADDTFGGEDYDFWLRMHLVTRFRHIREPLYKYRVHANTITARAHEFGVFDNIHEFLAADRWRLETLLTDGTLHRDDELLRPVAQFHSQILKRLKPVRYDEFVPAERPVLGDPVVVDIDVPARIVDPAVLRHADILLCRSPLTASLLRRAEWVRGKRVIAWEGEATRAVQHAFVQAFADQVTVPVTPRTPPQLPRNDDAFCPTRILLLVDRWSSGGLENIVIDLAQGLVAEGRTVWVASAHDGPPPAAAFGDARIRMLALRGDESALAALVGREGIEIVNYHHSSFAAAASRDAGAATVYTMHNCYLWMDAAARREVARGLALMDRVIAVSRQVAQFAAARFACPADKIDVVPNGLRIETASEDERPALAPGIPFSIAVVGSFNRLKLQHVALAAFGDVADDIGEMRLRLIGAPHDRAYYAELEARVTASPHRERIELIPGLDRAETIAALAEAHVFLSASAVEGYGLALAEAAATGCVCIASDVGAARDFAVSGGCVVLLPSPLGEMELATHEEFIAATASELPEHRANIAEALRLVWRDYGTYAAGVDETRTRLRDFADMRRMIDATLSAYTGARRGGRRILPQNAEDAAVGPLAVA